MSSILTSFDMLGINIGFRFNGNIKYRTKVGGFLTLCLLVTSIITISFFGQIYLSGEESRQIYSKEKLWNSQNLELTEDFVFALSTKIKGKNSKSSNIWEISSIYNQLNNFKSEANYTIIPFYDCNISHWPNEVNYQFNNLNINESLCFKISNVKLKGNPNTELFNYISLQYNMLIDENDLTNTTLIERQISDEFPVATLYFLESSYQINNKSIEKVLSINSININVTYGDAKEVDVLISEDKTRLSIDKLIFSENKEYSNYVVTSFREKVSVRAIGQTNSLKFNIISSNERNIVSISFMSFSEMLARIGGILQNLILLMSIFNYTRSYFNYERKQVNKLNEKISEDYQFNNFIKIFEFSNKKQVKTNLEQDIVDLEINRGTKATMDKVFSEDNQTRTIFNKKEIISSIKTNTFLKKEIKEKLNVSEISLKLDNMKSKIGSLLTKNNKLLNFNFYSWFLFKYCKFCVCKCCKNLTDKKIIFQEIQSHLNDILDIENAARRFFDLELLKYVLLDETQYYFFNKSSFISSISSIKNIKVEPFSDIKDKIRVFKELKNKSSINEKIHSLVLY